MTNDDVAAVQRIFDEMDAHVEADDARAYLRCNFAFHTSIYRHGASEMTLATIQNMWMRIGPFLNMVAPDVAHMRVSMQAHRQIIDALWKHDGAAAREGIVTDIRDAARDLEAHLRAQETHARRHAQS
jgi:DNA-binding GntR family transcriptional regulator